MIAGGCAAIGKKPTTIKNPIVTSLNYNMVMNEVRELNITDNGFIIKKGRIEIEGTGVDGNYGFNARMNTKGDFMASVKGPLGIEMLKLIIVGDDICMTDRIGKTNYIGKKNVFREKNSLPDNFVNIVFGDIAVYETWEIDTVIDNKLIINEVNEDFDLKTGICLNEMKVCSEKCYLRKRDTDILLNFNNFRLSSGNKYASEIVIREGIGNMKITIRIEDMAIGFEGNLNFATPPYKRKPI